MKSILQDEKECYLTGRTFNLHKHHVFNGNPQRKLSEQYGLWVWLNAEVHEKVHADIEIRKWLKETAQLDAMRYYGWTEDEFREKFGRSYL